MLKIGENDFLPSSVHMWGWVYVRSFRVRKVDLAYISCESEETLTALIKYKHSRLGPKTLTKIFSIQRALF